MFKKAGFDRFSSLITSRWSRIGLCDGPDMMLFMPVSRVQPFSVYCLVTWAEMVVYFCSSISVLLFDTPEICRCCCFLRG